MKRRLYDEPSEFSMILGVLPSRTATAELVVPRDGKLAGLWSKPRTRLLDIPRSMPMTCPLTFSSLPVDCHRANEDGKCERETVEREERNGERGS